VGPWRQPNRQYCDTPEPQGSEDLGPELHLNASGPERGTTR
jgi:hypothetical protein